MQVSFSEGFWNIFIIVVTLGSIGVLFYFVYCMSRGKQSTTTDETTGHVWDEDLTELNNPLPAWWKYMFYITLIFGLGYLALYPGLGSNDMLLKWTSLGEYEEEMAEAEATYGPLFSKYEKIPVAELATNVEALRMGERLYASYCTQCHGSDAGGVPGYPSLRDSDWIWGGTAERIEETILLGRTGVMPGWSSVLGEAGVTQVSAYVQSLSGREVDNTAAEAGRELYTKNCAACHQADGKGNTALGAVNLTDKIWLYGGSPKTIEKTIGKGRQGKMPAHEAFLGKAKVHLLAAYIYSLSQPE